MSEDAAKNFTSILEYLHLTLRYVASGFVAIGVYMFLYDPDITQFKDLSGFLLFLTATIGIITYGLHFATLDKIFYGWAISIYLAKKNGFIPDILRKQIIDWERLQRSQNGDEQTETQDKWFEYERRKGKFGFKNNNKLKRQILFALANQTYLRNLSKNSMLKEMQTQVEKRLALLNFLYCSSYQILILNLCFLIPRWFCFNSFSKEDSVKAYGLLIFALVMLYSAFRFNQRICSREMWLVTNFPQTVEKVKLENEDTKHC